MRPVGIRGAKNGILSIDAIHDSGLAVNALGLYQKCMARKPIPQGQFFKTDDENKSMVAGSPEPSTEKHPAVQDAIKQHEGERILNPLERIQSLQIQIRKETDALKTQLAKELSAACKSFEVLKQLGVEDVLSEPDYFEYRNILGIGNSSPSAPAATKTKTNAAAPSDVRPGSVADAINQTLANGTAMDIATIVGGVAKIKPGTSSATVNLTLGKMFKDGLIKKPARGIYQKL